MTSDHNTQDDGGTFREEDEWRHIKPEIRSALLVAYSHGAVLSGRDRFEAMGTFTVGRKAPSGIVIEDGWLSGEHFEISRFEETTFIRDLGSTNGTFLNGLPLVGRQKLPGSAVIRHRWGQ